MNELKWYWAFDPYLDPPEKQKESAQKAGYVKVVNKSDADKVIAELEEKLDGMKWRVDEWARAANDKDKQIEELKDSIGKLLKAKTEQVMDEVFQKSLIYGEGFVPVEHAMRLVAELRHNKQKRCLAMAQECEEAYNRECGLNPEEMTNKEFYRQQIEFWPRWSSKWLELADKFKEAK